MTPFTHNTLFYGDNLEILREHFPNECVDLIYLDPPFNSNRSYNVLFKDESGKNADAQITAFDDTWHWGESAEKVYHAIIQANPGKVDDMLVALRQIIGTNQMLAYLVMMAARLVELHRVLRPTGSLYLHCDPTASHYLKIILDTVFGAENFVNEIIWQRTSAHSDAKQGAKHLGRVHDIIFFYVKSQDYTWNPLYLEHDEAYKKSHYPHTSSTGRRYGLWDITGPGGAAKGNPFYEIFGISKYWRYSREKMEAKIKEGRIIQPNPGSIPREIRYFDESPGVPLGSVWSDISPINSQAAERLGYPTQKPLTLLERIIQSSSNPGDLVLDPFCGCGTAVAAAQKLDRRWIGIDITHLSITLQKFRLKDAFKLEPNRDYSVIGEPMDIGSARQLAGDDRYQFQWWALSLVGARPAGAEPTSKQGKKGSDKGIDGIINFIDDSSSIPKHALIQVKSGHVKSGDIRDLHGVLDRDKAAIGVFITLEAPTKDMLKEASSAGYYHSNTWDQDYPCIQIYTIEQLLSGAKVLMPAQHGTFKKAEKIQKAGPKQSELGL